MPPGEATWIDDGAELARCCEALKASGSFAYDTAFIGEETYYPRICVVQVATTRAVTLIDALTIGDLSPLWNLIADEDVTTIVHAGQQDLEPVARLLGAAPNSIVDTQLAAGLSGLPWPLSLTKLISAVLSHDVGAGPTFSEWDARPLTPSQMAYAADDVRYLPALWSLIEQRLADLGRTAWAEAEFASLTSMDAFAFDLDAAVRRTVRNRSPRKAELARICALVTERERIARSEGHPPRSIFPDDVLRALARSPVADVDALANFRGFPRDIAAQYGAALLSSIESPGIEHLPHIRRSNPREGDGDMRLALDGLWSLTCAWCAGNDLAPGLVVTRPAFTDWYLAREAGNPPPDSPLTNGWRSEVMDAVGRCIDGDSTLRFARSDRLAAREDRA